MIVTAEGKDLGKRESGWKENAEGKEPLKCTLVCGRLRETCTIFKGSRKAGLTQPFRENFALLATLLH